MRDNFGSEKDYSEQNLNDAVNEDHDRAYCDSPYTDRFRRALPHGSLETKEISDALVKMMSTQHKMKPSETDFEETPTDQMISPIESLQVTSTTTANPSVRFRMNNEEDVSDILNIEKELDDTVASETETAESSSLLSEIHGISWTPLDAVTKLEDLLESVFPETTNQEPSESVNSVKSVPKSREEYTKKDEGETVASLNLLDKTGREDDDSIATNESVYPDSDETEATCSEVEDDTSGEVMTMLPNEETVKPKIIAGKSDRNNSEYYVDIDFPYDTDSQVDYIIPRTKNGNSNNASVKKVVERSDGDRQIWKEFKWPEHRKYGNSKTKQRTTEKVEAESKDLEKTTERKAGDRQIWREFKWPEHRKYNRISTESSETEMGISSDGSTSMSPTKKEWGGDRQIWKEFKWPDHKKYGNLKSKNVETTRKEIEAISEGAEISADENSGDRQIWKEFKWPEHRKYNRFSTESSKDTENQISSEEPTSSSAKNEGNGDRQIWREFKWPEHRKYNRISTESLEEVEKKILDAEPTSASSAKKEGSGDRQIWREFKWPDHKKYGSLNTKNFGTTQKDVEAIREGGVISAEENTGDRQIWKEFKWPEHRKYNRISTESLEEVEKEILGAERTSASSAKKEGSGDRQIWREFKWPDHKKYGSLNSKNFGTTQKDVEAIREGGVISAEEKTGDRQIWKEFKWPEHRKYHGSGPTSTSKSITSEQNEDIDDTDTEVEADWREFQSEEPSASRTYSDEFENTLLEGGTENIKDQYSKELKEVESELDKIYSSEKSVQSSSGPHVMETGLWEELHLPFHKSAHLKIVSKKPETYAQEPERSTFDNGKWNRFQWPEHREHSTSASTPLMQTAIWDKIHLPFHKTAHFQVIGETTETNELEESGKLSQEEYTESSDDEFFSPNGKTAPLKDPGVKEGSEVNTESFEAAPTENDEHLLENLKDVEHTTKIIENSFSLDELENSDETGKKVVSPSEDYNDYSLLSNDKYLSDVSKSSSESENVENQTPTLESMEILTEEYVQENNEYSPSEEFPDKFQTEIIHRRPKTTTEEYPTKLPPAATKSTTVGDLLELAEAIHFKKNHRTTTEQYLHGPFKAPPGSTLQTPVKESEDDDDNLWNFRVINEDEAVTFHHKTKKPTHKSTTIFSFKPIPTTSDDWEIFNDLPKQEVTKPTTELEEEGKKTTFLIPLATPTGSEETVGNLEGKEDILNVQSPVSTEQPPEYYDEAEGGVTGGEVKEPDEVENGFDSLQLEQATFRQSELFGGNKDTTLPSFFMDKDNDDERIGGDADITVESDDILPVPTLSDLGADFMKEQSSFGRARDPYSVLERSFLDSEYSSNGGKDFSKTSFTEDNVEGLATAVVEPKTIESGENADEETLKKTQHLLQTLEGPSILEKVKKKLRNFRPKPVGIGVEVETNTPRNYELDYTYPEAVEAVIAVEKTTGVSKEYHTSTTSKQSKMNTEKFHVPTDKFKELLDLASQLEKEQSTEFSVKEYSTTTPSSTNLERTEITEPPTEGLSVGGGESATSSHGMSETATTTMIRVELSSELVEHNNKKEGTTEFNAASTSDHTETKTDIEKMSMLLEELEKSTTQESDIEKQAIPGASTGIEEDVLRTSGEFEVSSVPHNEPEEHKHLSSSHIETDELKTEESIQRFGTSEENISKVSKSTFENSGEHTTQTHEFLHHSTAILGEEELSVSTSSISPLGEESQKSSTVSHSKTKIENKEIIGNIEEGREEFENNLAHLPEHETSTICEICEEESDVKHGSTSEKYTATSLKEKVEETHSEHALNEDLEEFDSNLVHMPMGEHETSTICEICDVASSEVTEYQREKLVDTTETSKDREAVSTPIESNVSQKNLEDLQQEEFEENLNHLPQHETSTICEICEEDVATPTDSNVSRKNLEELRQEEFEENLNHLPQHETSTICEICEEEESHSSSKSVKEESSETQGQLDVVSEPAAPDNLQLEEIDSNLHHLPQQHAQETSTICEICDENGNGKPKKTTLPEGQVMEEEEEEESQTTTTSEKAKTGLTYNFKGLLVNHPAPTTNKNVLKMGSTRTTAELPDIEPTEIVTDEALKAAENIEHKLEELWMAERNTESTEVQSTGDETHGFSNEKLSSAETLGHTSEEETHTIAEDSREMPKATNFYTEYRSEEPEQSTRMGTDKVSSMSTEEEEIHTSTTSEESLHEAEHLSSTESEEHTKLASNEITSEIPSGTHSHTSEEKISENEVTGITGKVSSSEEEVEKAINTSTHSEETPQEDEHSSSQESEENTKYASDEINSEIPAVNHSHTGEEKISQHVVTEITRKVSEGEVEKEINTLAYSEETLLDEHLSSSENKESTELASEEITAGVSSKMNLHTTEGKKSEHEGNEITEIEGEKTTHMEKELPEHPERTEEQKSVSAIRISESTESESKASGISSNAQEATSHPGEQLDTTAESLTTASEEETSSEGNAKIGFEGSTSGILSTGGTELAQNVENKLEELDEVIKHLLVTTPGTEMLSDHVPEDFVLEDAIENLKKEIDEMLETTLSAEDILHGLDEKNESLVDLGLYPSESFGETEEQQKSENGKVHLAVEEMKTEGMSTVSLEETKENRFTHDEGTISLMSTGSEKESEEKHQSTETTVEGATQEEYKEHTNFYTDVNTASTVSSNEITGASGGFETHLSSEEVSHFEKTPSTHGTGEDILTDFYTELNSKASEEEQVIENTSEATTNEAHGAIEEVEGIKTEKTEIPISSISFSEKTFEENQIGSEVERELQNLHHEFEEMLKTTASSQELLSEENLLEEIDITPELDGIPSFSDTISENPGTLSDKIDNELSELNDMVNEFMHTTVGHEKHEPVTESGEKEFTEMDKEIEDLNKEFEELLQSTVSGEEISEITENASAQDIAESISEGVPTNHPEEEISTRTAGKEQITAEESTSISENEAGISMTADYTNVTEDTKTETNFYTDVVTAEEIVASSLFTQNSESVGETSNIEGHITGEYSTENPAKTGEMSTNKIKQKELELDKLINKILSSTSPRETITGEEKDNTAGEEELDRDLQELKQEFDVMLSTTVNPDNLMEAIEEALSPTTEPEIESESSPTEVEESGSTLLSEEEITEEGLERGETSSEIKTYHSEKMEENETIKEKLESSSKVENTEKTSTSSLLENAEESSVLDHSEAEFSTEVGSESIISNADAESSEKSSTEEGIEIINDSTTVETSQEKATAVQGSQATAGEYEGTTSEFESSEKLNEGITETEELSVSANHTEKNGSTIESSTSKSNTAERFSSVSLLTTILLSLVTSTTQAPDKGYTGLANVPNHQNMPKCLVVFITGESPLLPINGSKWVPSECPPSGQQSTTVTLIKGGSTEVPNIMQSTMEVPESSSTEVATTLIPVEELPEIKTKNFVEDGCTEQDFENNNKCFCMIDSTVDNMAERLGGLNSSKVNNIKCSKFLKVNKGLVMRNDTTAALKRSRRSYLYLKYLNRQKREIVDYNKIDEVLANELTVGSTDKIVYSPVGVTATIPCFYKEEAVERENFMKFVWTADDDKTLVFSDRIRETTDGALKISDVTIEDGGNYTCSVNRPFGNTETEQKRFKHELLIIRWPIFKVKSNVMYVTDGECSLKDGDVVHAYLPRMLEDLLCGLHKRVCKVEMERPSCVEVEEKTYLSIKYIVTLAGISHLIPSITTSSECDYNCQMKVTGSLVSLLIKNVETTSVLDVISDVSSFNHTFKPRQVKFSADRSLVQDTSLLPKLVIGCPPGFGVQSAKKICVVCPRNTYNAENGSACSPCPSIQYQPKIGSTSCIECKTPFDDKACVGMMFANKSFLVVYIGSSVALVFFLLLCIFCAQTSTQVAFSGPQRRKKAQTPKRKRIGRKDVEDPAEKPLLPKDPTVPKIVKGPKVPPPDF